MTQRVLKNIVPVDDADHVVHVHSWAPVLEAEATAVDEVSFWWLARPDLGVDGGERTFRIFGTGHPVPDNYTHRATCPHRESGMVWHLFERIV